MNLNLGFELEARVELIKTREHYRNISPDMALDFDADFEKVVKEMFAFPESFAPVGDDIRRARMSQFPYFIYYTLDPDAIFIYAIAHQRKDQMYWRHRIKPT